MGIHGETPIVLRDIYSKKIYIKRIDEILECDYNNFEMWTNIGWSKIKNITEEMNFSQIFTINSDIGIIKITPDLFNKVYEFRLPKYNLDAKWRLTNEEAFLLGYFLKYGMLDNRFNLIIQDTHKDCKHIKDFLKIFDKVEGVKSYYEKMDDNNYVIKNIYKNLIWNKYFSFCYNINNQKIIPDAIINSNFLVKTCFLLGFLGKLNYDKTDPFNYLNRCLENEVFMTVSEKLLSGLFYISKNIGLETLIKTCQKGIYKYYIIYKKYKCKNKENRQGCFDIDDINTYVPNTYNIIPENPKVNTISIGIGELGIRIK